jgi:hypothetical protein
MGCFAPTFRQICIAFQFFGKIKQWCELVFDNYKCFLFLFQEVVIIVYLLIKSIAILVQLKGVDIKSLLKL